jgi:hypothetical protein
MKNGRNDMTDRAWRDIQLRSALGKSHLERLVDDCHAPIDVAFM